MVVEQNDVPSLHIRLKAATPAHLQAAHNVELSVPQNAGRNALRKLLYHLLALPESSRPEFHFLAGDEPLRTTFDNFLRRRNLSAEATLDVTYYLALPEPREESSIDASTEWISSVSAFYAGSKQPMIVAGSYSGAPCVYRGTDTVISEASCTEVRHAAPIKGVTWLNDGQRFVTAGQDQCARVWSVDKAAEVATPFAEFRTETIGDAVGLGSVAISKEANESAALGADDGSLWVLPDIPQVQSAPQKIGNKRKEADTAVIAAVRVGASTAPLPMTGVAWRGRNVVSAGWDALIRVWDVDACASATTIPCGGKAVADISITEQSILVAAIDGGVRLIDARDGKGVVAACGRKGAHHGIVNAIQWMDKDRNCVSGGIDGTLRFWDVRSMMVPVRVLKEIHGGKQCLGLDCVIQERTWCIFSAGADGKVARITI